MKVKKFSEKPLDIETRIGAKPIICYPNTDIEEKNLSILHSARKHLVKKDEVIIPPRDAKTFEVKFGEFFRIESVDGPQVGDLNLFNLNNLEEKFYSGKTRALKEASMIFGDTPIVNQLTPFESVLSILTLVIASVPVFKILTL